MIFYYFPDLPDPMRYFTRVVNKPIQSNVHDPTVSLTAAREEGGPIANPTWCTTDQRLEPFIGLTPVTKWYCVYFYHPGIHPYLAGHSAVGMLKMTIISRILNLG